MARRGRPPKKGERHACGKLKQPTVTQLEEMAKKKAIAEKELVLAQPHRLGNLDQRCASALGRFCIRHGLRQELYDAGEDYAALIRRWRAAKGVPTDLRLGIGGNGDGPSDETVNGWTEKMHRLQKAIVRDASPEALVAVQALAVDDWDVAPGWEQAGIGGLMALAREFGAIKPGDLRHAA